MSLNSPAVLMVLYIFLKWMPMEVIDSQLTRRAPNMGPDTVTHSVPETSDLSTGSYVYAYATLRNAMLIYVASQGELGGLDSLQRRGQYGHVL